MKPPGRDKISGSADFGTADTAKHRAAAILPLLVKNSVDMAGIEEREKAAI